MTADTSVKKITPMFDVCSKTKVFTQIATIPNEIRLYELMNVTGLIFNLNVKEIVEKDGKQMFATFNGKMYGCIKILFFGGLYDMYANLYE